ncbi:hypothetical protein TRIUR3_02960 [Triticum urartu]|uniref:F-box protein AT5G49610-like beta-propeller domain-containing protein n=1 Tax=Triticum urartu TaxID=4572 RepID=M7Y555_TRIUA|nr:hypothetical protein TRIUR3_02960 [Triticum urartu]
MTEIELQYAATFFAKMLPPVHGKVFVVTGFGYTLGLDLATATFVILQLPAGVRYNYMLSSAEGSGIYLVTADRFQLSVWLHRMTGDNHGAGGWLLVDTFSVLEACARLAGDSWVPCEYLNVAAVGDNADFVFLDHPSSGVIFYVQPSSRVVKMVYQRMADEHECTSVAVRISPVMTIWPPIFPALNIGHDQEILRPFVHFTIQIEGTQPVPLSFSMYEETIDLCPIDGVSTGQVNEDVEHMFLHLASSVVQYIRWEWGLLGLSDLSTEDDPSVRRQLTRAIGRPEVVLQQLILASNSIRFVEYEWV